ncbi:MAG: DUF4381 domain-containing protein [Bdellovibrionota bacterium]|nr:DUF4381 domain-containing protein [Deltaproteobacteria bacterium]
MDFEQIPLRDIHLPHAIGYWPVSIGWWVMLVLFVALVFAVWRYKKYKQNHIGTLSLNAFHEIVKKYEKNKNDAEFSKELSILIRRIVISKFPRKDTASLVGQQWLEFLDKMAECEDFTKGCGRQIITAPYQNKSLDRVDDLIQVVEKWIKKVTYKKEAKHLL